MNGGRWDLHIKIHEQSFSSLNFIHPPILLHSLPQKIIHDSTMTNDFAGSCIRSRKLASRGGQGGGGDLLSLLKIELWIFMLGSKLTFVSLHSIL